MGWVMSFFVCSRVLCSFCALLWTAGTGLCENRSRMATVAISSPKRMHCLRSSSNLRKPLNGARSSHSISAFRWVIVRVISFSTAVSSFSWSEYSSCLVSECAAVATCSARNCRFSLSRL
uniref:Putative secreted protein n=1 Tax=Anopheles triannulatus TaxID=58253 RepID=A0A2M4B2B5_9DIPT